MLLPTPTAERSRRSLNQAASRLGRRPQSRKCETREARNAPQINRTQESGLPAKTIASGVPHGELGRQLASSSSGVAELRRPGPERRPRAVEPAFQ
jgi:hypothetical protein